MREILLGSEAERWAGARPPRGKQGLRVAEVRNSETVESADVPSPRLEGRATRSSTALRKVGVSTTVIAVLAMIVACTMVGFSYWQKTPCLAGPYDDLGSTKAADLGHSLVCYTDVQQLWLGRGIGEGSFPYVHGYWEPDPNGYGTGTVMYGAIEYPVVTGLFMWVAKQPAHNVADYVLWTTLFLAPFAAATAWFLARLTRWRVFIWAAAPALIFYSAYNWDLLPVAMCAGAVYAWARGRSLVAAALFGLGAATKIYPGFFLLPMVLERLISRDVKGAAKVAGVGAGTWLAVNLPFILINYPGWVATYRFQLGRTADLTTNSIYFWGMEIDLLDMKGMLPPQVDHLSTALMGLTWVVAIGIGWFRRREADGYPWLGVGAAMLCGFLAYNKVYSPQYFMWVLPFLVLLRVRWGWWVSYALIDAALFLGINRWFGDNGDQVAKQAAMFGVWGKTVILTLLVVVLARAPLAFERRPRTEATAPAEREETAEPAPA
jgi:hypothetical protein